MSEQSPREPADQRPAAARRPRAIRLNHAEDAAVQEIADRDGLPWSEAARRMLRYAAAHMPDGWHR